MDGKVTVCPPGYAWGYKPSDQWFISSVDNDLAIIEFFDAKDLPKKGGKKK